ncbi:MAG: hypothetical protein VX987_03925 [Pseudomonadota bacterium]|nr:hypothetical protein [Pseudomonadota bacterium]
MLARRHQVAHISSNPGNARQWPFRSAATRLEVARLSADQHDRPRAEMPRRRQGQCQVRGLREQLADQTPKPQ